MGDMYCLIYYRGKPRRARKKEAAGARWRLVLEDGEEIRFPGKQVLYQ